MKNLPFHPLLKPLILLIAIIVLFLNSGCSLLDKDAIIDDLTPQPDVISTTTTTTTTTTQQDNRSYTTWKAESESRGHVLVIIIEYPHRQDDFKKTVKMNGEWVTPKDWRDDYENGNRIHVFFPKHGSEYGGAAVAEFPMADGQSFYAWVNNAGAYKKRAHTDIGASSE